MPVKKCLLILCLLFPLGCVEEIDLNVLNAGTSNRLVVEGSITSEQKAHFVKLSRTNTAIPKEAAPGVSGAVVSISDDSTVFRLWEVDTLPGVYLTDPTVAGSVDKTYTLRIELAGEVYTATARMEPVAPFGEAGSLFGPPNRLQNPIPGNLEVFELEFPKVRYGAAAPAKEMFFARDPVENQLISAFYYQFPGIDPDGFLLNFSGANQRLFLEAGTLVAQHKHSLSKEHYQFIRAVYAQTQFRGGLFDRVPANVVGNVSNGALGFFSASDVITRSFTVSGAWLGQ